MTHYARICTAIAATLVPLLATVSGARDGRSKPFALFYHSDTRGYYRPCG